MSRFRSGWLSSDSLKMFVDELPSLRPLRVLLFVSVAVMPVTFVHVEFVEELRPETKLPTARLKFQSASWLEVLASIALEGITRDYKSLTWYNKFESFSCTANTTLQCPVNPTGAPRSGTQFPCRSPLGAGLSN